MNLRIQRGKISRPQRVVIYAPEGLGKSTLASELPNPLFLDFEKGTHHLDVARLEPSNLQEVEAVLEGLAKDSQGFQTLIVDTIDWLEELAVAAICAEHRKKSVEDFGYGKGYVILSERFNGILAALDRVADKMHVVCLAHSQVKKFELPDSAGAYDRYELKLSKHVSPLVREWCDALLFGNWKTVVKELDNDKFKAVASSGRERILYASHSAAWDAKNRHGLADAEKWSVETVNKILSVMPDKPSATLPAPATSEAGQSPKAGAANASEGREAPHKTDGIPGLPPENGGARELSPVLVATCEPNEDAVNAFLVSRGQIQGGQTWRDVSVDYEKRICANPAKFLEFVKPKEAAAA